MSGSEPPAYDHEHPCPSKKCVEDMRRQGFDVPEGTECCICWVEQYKAGLE